MNHFKKDMTFFKPQTVSNKTSQIEEGKKKKILNIYMLKEKYGNPILKFIICCYFIV